MWVVCTCRYDSPYRISTFDIGTVQGWDQTTKSGSANQNEDTGSVFKELQKVSEEEAKGNFLIEDAKNCFSKPDTEPKIRLDQGLIEPVSLFFPACELMT